MVEDPKLKLDVGLDEANTPDDCVVVGPKGDCNGFDPVLPNWKRPVEGCVVVD